MSADAQGVDAEIGELVLSRSTEDELVDLFHKSSTPAQRWRVVGELADRRRGGQQ